MDSNDELIKEIVRDGWGASYRYCGWKVRRNEDKYGYQFASHLEKGTLTLEVDVVIKKQPHSEITRKLMFSDSQFYNEVLMYEKLLPFLEATDFVLKMHWGRATQGKAPEEDIIVLQFHNDYSGHRCNSNFLDLDHLKLCLTKLGQYHALSYNAKEKGLKNAALKLNSVGFGRRNPEDYALWMNGALMRGITPLLSKPIYKDVLEQLIDRFRELEQVIDFLESYEDSTAVLCHGDFCSNNMLFKYNEKGFVEDVKFIDFQTSRYASPVTDLSFFLYLNTSAEIMTSHWDELLDLYVSSLHKKVMDQYTPPTRQEILEEFSVRALYGYIHCSFFLPVMINHQKNQPYDPHVPPDNVGGDEATDAVMNVMKHLIDRGYINAFLSKCINTNKRSSM